MTIFFPFNAIINYIFGSNQNIENTVQQSPFSSSDASEDEGNEGRKKRGGHEAGGPVRKRDSGGQHDDSSDSQDQGGGGVVQGEWCIMIFSLNSIYMGGSESSLVNSGPKSYFLIMSAT